MRELLALPGGLLLTEKEQTEDPLGGSSYSESKSFSVMSLTDDTDRPDMELETTLISGSLLR